MFLSQRTKPKWSFWSKLWVIDLLHADVHFNASKSLNTPTASTSALSTTFWYWITPQDRHPIDLLNARANVQDPSLILPDQQQSSVSGLTMPIVPVYRCRSHQCQLWSASRYVSKGGNPEPLKLTTAVAQRWDMKCWPHSQGSAFGVCRWDRRPQLLLLVPWPTSLWKLLAIKSSSIIDTWTTWAIQSNKQTKRAQLPLDPLAVFNAPWWVQTIDRLFRRRKIS